MIVQGQRLGTSFGLGNSVFPAPFIEEAVFSPAHILGTFVKNEMAVVAYISVRVFYSIGLHDCFCASTMLFSVL
jgi:hypothetical protein